jgi:DNA (cytosine-5)-methyltransferase 1
MILKKNIQLIYIDLFCGAGGTSTGVTKARLFGKQCAIVGACINHDKNAIASHAENHPHTLHFTEDIRTLDLTELIAHIALLRVLYPNAKIVLWASLECTNFSKAKGGQPRDADSRTLAEHLFRYIDAIDPDYIQIENVEEFMSWGELDKKGKPISKSSGCDYVRWVKNVCKYGYNFDHRLLNAADFEAYTSRKRFFGLFVKHGLPVAWPEPTRCKGGATELFSDLKKWKAVREVLDFSDEGTSIFRRKKPLVPASLERSYAGLIKFVAGGHDKWLLKYNSMSRSGKHVPPSIDEPSPVVSCQNRLGLFSACFLSKQFSGHPESKNISVDQPAGTITTVDHHAIVTPSFLASYYGNGDNVSSVDNPAPTVTTKDRISKLQCKFIANSYSGGGQIASIDNPSPTVTGVPKQNVVSCKFIDQQFGQSKPASIDNPCGALTANPKYNLVSCTPWIMNTNFGNVGSSIDVPAQTVTANRKWHYLMNPQYRNIGSSIDRPCFTLIARMDKSPAYLMQIDTEGECAPFVKMNGNTITYEIYDDDSEIMIKIKEFMALYGIIDIKMRMLKIDELKLIMGFPKDYKLIGTQADQKKFIGNAVEVNQAKVLAEALAMKLYKMELKSIAA